MTQYDGFQWFKREGRWYGVTCERRFIATVKLGERVEDKWILSVHLSVKDDNGKHADSAHLFTAEFPSLPLAQDGAAVMLREWLTAASDELGAVS